MKSRASTGLARWVPIVKWVRAYRAADFPGDAIAGVIVAIMLVPQAMAYAMLAGLPAQVGLYASIVPLLLYGIFGSSRTLAVGPVAIVSLLTASAIQRVAPEGGAAALSVALTLAALSGTMMLAMGLAQLGFLTNFLSHPVIKGFTSAAALIIALSQLKHLLGIQIPHSEQTHALIGHIFGKLAATNLTALLFGAVAIAVLVFFGKALGPLLRRGGVSETIATPLVQTGPLFVVIAATVLVWALRLDESAGVKVVGTVAAGLPPLSFPPLAWERLQPLLGAALAISFVGFMESISVAKTLASKRRENVDPDRELIALGFANLGSALTSGYSVTGGFSRSVVNFAAGARTPLASMITAVLVGLTVLALTPLFYFVPQAVLAAIIIVAVAGLIDHETPVWLWRYSKGDFASFVLTFGIVLFAGVELGVAIGAGTALAIFLWRASRPHLAVLGRIGNTEHFRNIHRHEVSTCPEVLAIRVDESLFFANARFLEDHLLRLVAEQEVVKDLVLDCSAINHIDSSALETLEKLVTQLRDSGVGFHLAGVKGPVMDRLERSGFPERFGRGCIHLSLDQAMKAVGCGAGDSVFASSPGEPAHSL